MHWTIGLTGYIGLLSPKPNNNHPGGAREYVFVWGQVQI